MHDFLLTNDSLFKHRVRCQFKLEQMLMDSIEQDKVYVVKQYIHNDISSTKIR